MAKKQQSFSTESSIHDGFSHGTSSQERCWFDKTTHLVIAVTAPMALRNITNTSNGGFSSESKETFTICLIIAFSASFSFLFLRKSPKIATVLHYCSIIAMTTSLVMLVSHPYSQPAATKEAQATS